LRSLRGARAVPVALELVDGSVVALGAVVVPLPCIVLLSVVLGDVAVESVVEPADGAVVLPPWGCCAAGSVVPPDGCVVLVCAYAMPMAAANETIATPRPVVYLLMRGLL
jgi:hypothetical protein